MEQYGAFGGGGWSSVLCMGIDSIVEHSFVALAQYFSSLAHPCKCMQFYPELDLFSTEME